MKIKTIYFLIALCAFLGSLILLISGSPYLTKSVIPGQQIPLGTISTWLGIIALSLLFVFGNGKLSERKDSFDKTILLGFKICFYLALSWGIVSYLLAGNWAYNFRTSDKFVGSTEAYEYFRYFTILVVALPFIIALFYGLISLKRRIVRRQSQS